MQATGFLEFLMSLISNGRSDVKNHLSAHHKSHLHLVGPDSQPDATGFSGNEAVSTETNQTDSVQQAALGLVEAVVPGQRNGPATSATAIKPLA